MLELKEITYDNLKAVIKLSDTLSEQDKKHVVPNVESLAEAYLNYDIAWPRAIIVDDVVVGFVMLGLDNPIAEEKDWPVYFLWRFMMGTKYQVKGYGKQTLDLLVQMYTTYKLYHLVAQVRATSSVVESHPIAT